MNNILLTGPAGYAIPCLWQLEPEDCRALIVCHGFGSHKQSLTAQALRAELAPLSVGVFSFDFPAHGESPVDGDSLRIANCLDDIAAVEDFAAGLAPQAELCYFGSSFGAYVLALYLALRPHRGRKALLRCAAVTMPELLVEKASAEDLELLETQGYAMADEGYLRPLKITREFVADLNGHDAFRLCRPGMAELLMIHGSADQTAPLQTAQSFAERFGARLTIVEGADHHFEGPGETEQVLAAAREFFTSL